MKKAFLFAASLFLFTGLMAQQATAKKALAKPAVHGGQANQLTLDSVKNGVGVAAKSQASSTHGGQANQLMLDSARNGGAGVAAKAQSSSVRGGQANQLTIDSARSGGTTPVSRTITADKNAKAMEDFIKQNPPPPTKPKKPVK